jgi:hypothetical protein
VEAASTGARRIETRMAEAISLASLHGVTAVDQALGLAAFAGRFADGDLESIIVHAATTTPQTTAPPAEHSLAKGTSAWSALGTGEGGPK